MHPRASSAAEAIVCLGAVAYAVGPVEGASPWRRSTVEADAVRGYSAVDGDRRRGALSRPCRPDGLRHWSQ